MIPRSFSHAVLASALLLGMAVPVRARSAPEAPPTAALPPLSPDKGPPPVPPPEAPTPELPNDTPSFGRGGLTGILGFGGAAGPQASYRFLWLPDQSVANQAAKLGLIQQAASISTPLWREGGDTWTLSAHAHGETFFTHAILPDSHRTFPDELWNVNLGTNYSHRFDNGWTGGGGISVGSASDQLFSSTRQMTIGANGFLAVPQGEHNAWLFTLAYSPTSELAIPLPGVAYLWQPSDSLRVHVGLPLQVLYRPIDELTLDFSYMLVRTVHANATYRVTRQFSLFGGFDWSSESYFLTDREDPRERFFYYDKRASAGVQTKLGAHVQMELSGGYSFDRFYFQGRSYSDRFQDRVDLSDGPFVAIQGRVRW